MCLITSMATALGVSTAAVWSGVIGAAVSAVSTAISVTSSVQQSKTQQAMYNYQAEQDRHNAKIAEINAADERQSGLEEARLQRMKVLSAIGSQQTGMAANGIDITQGTALDTIEDTATMGELDALMTMYNSERTAINYERQAANFNNQANLDVIAGQNARRAGTINAIGYGLQGISDMSGGGLGNIGKVSNKWKNNSGHVTGITPSLTSMPSF